MTVLNPKNIPLSLYIHMPWCVKKCPYCDFNSHTVPDGTLSLDLEQQYLHALVEDLNTQLEYVQERCIESIFIGGGTPSLISAHGYTWLFEQIKRKIEFRSDCEITLEANPGTLEHQPFEDYLKAGINRLSLGVQTFDTTHLQKLGRIHSANNAVDAIQNAKKAGFQRVNVDLMHGLPDQSCEQALFDLKQAVEHGATHISWYQLTIEPNTVFFRTKPILPHENTLEDIQSQGEVYLRSQGFVQYEVSAWRKEAPSRHNMNYWQFGDYLAIGAGAHGKVTLNHGIYRFQKTRQPKDYLADVPAPNIHWQHISEEEMPFEFMMNVLRLNQGISVENYTLRTGLSLEPLHAKIKKLQKQGLLRDDREVLACTTQGHLFLNTVLEQFL
ncbi:radical SAM family heme chaperone HemW [Acinetobacter sp. B5B]|uniref:radical SAM family heme chaperone HemW n=1 Tax=Acinetobacter baretiae TaxID=2605383 RepID=UPI0018C25959|nr:radical SAM family heme chaperone HemW [Acinetobacter baretiae]MBF7683821.1 radical SAM family heme chaperone HemW [Acinetobacter baretiae]